MSMLAPIKAPVSIVSGKVADDLLAALPADGSVVFIGPLPDGTGRLEVITISARRLTRGRTQQGMLALSGGVRITASTQGAPNVGGSSWLRPISRRLGPGWTDGQFRRAASRCFADASARSHLELHQENVFAAFESHSKNKDLIDAAERAGVETGHTIVYSEMTHDDCSFWLSWLDSYFTAGAAQAREAK